MTDTFFRTAMRNGPRLDEGTARRRAGRLDAAAPIRTAVAQASPRPAAVAAAKSLTLARGPSPRREEGTTVTNYATPPQNDREACEDFLAFFPTLAPTDRTRCIANGLDYTLNFLGAFDPRFRGVVPPPKVQGVGTQNKDRAVVDALLRDWRGLPARFSNRLLSMPLAEVTAWLASLGAFGARFTTDGAAPKPVSSSTLLQGRDREEMDRAMGLTTHGRRSGIQPDGSFAIHASSQPPKAGR